MNDHDTTPSGAGPNPAAPDANDTAPAAGATCAPPDGAPHPCATACDHQGCHAAWFAKKARADGLVWCCDREGWVTPTEAFEHSWDAYSGWGDDL